MIYRILENGQIKFRMEHFHPVTQDPLAAGPSLFNCKRGFTDMTKYYQNFNFL